MFSPRRRDDFLKSAQSAGHRVENASVAAQNAAHQVGEAAQAWELAAYVVMVCVLVVAWREVLRSG